jgi:transcriptional regulator with XRE-family HTH domain
MKDELACLDIGNQVRKLRNARTMTLQDLADLSGLSKQNLSQIGRETAKHKTSLPSQQKTLQFVLLLQNFPD